MIKIKGFENYSVDEDGNVFATDLGKFLNSYSNGLGYRAVKLRKNGVRYQKYVHRLVAEAYLGDTEGYEINHIDANKENNNKGNLELVTRSQNLKHAFDNKLLKGFVARYYR